jgi:hypothetical protein
MDSIALRTSIKCGKSNLYQYFIGESNLVLIYVKGKYGESHDKKTALPAGCRHVWVVI